MSCSEISADWAAQRIEGPSHSKNASAAARHLRCRDFLTVSVVTRERHLIENNWMYFHEPGVQVGGVQNFKSWAPERAPSPNLTCYGLEYFCFEGDRLGDSSDEDLIALGRREISLAASEMTRGPACAISRSDVMR